MIFLSLFDGPKSRSPYLQHARKAHPARVSFFPDVHAARPHGSIAIGGCVVNSKVVGANPSDVAVNSILPGS
jgi:hypothetical protein